MRSFGSTSYSLKTNASLHRHEVYSLMFLDFSINRQKEIYWKPEQEILFSILNNFLTPLQKSILRHSYVLSICRLKYKEKCQTYRFAINIGEISKRKAKLISPLLWITYSLVTTYHFNLLFFVHLKSLSYDDKCSWM